MSPTSCRCRSFAGTLGAGGVYPLPDEFGAAMDELDLRLAAPPRSLSSKDVLAAAPLVLTEVLQYFLDPKDLEKLANMTVRDLVELGL